MRIEATIPFGAVIATEFHGLASLRGDRRRSIGCRQLLVDRAGGGGGSKGDQAMVLGASSIIGRLCDGFAETVGRVDKRTIRNSVR